MGVNVLHNISHCRAGSSANNRALLNFEYLDMCVRFGMQSIPCPTHFAFHACNCARAHASWAHGQLKLSARGMKLLKKRTRFRNLQISGQISRFLAISVRFRDFREDFEISGEISREISRFQGRFRDFKGDFEISRQISREISGFYGET